MAGQHLTHLIREQSGPIQVNRVKMIKSKELPTTSEGGDLTAQVIFDPKAEMKRTLQELQRRLDEPSEAKLLAENLQTVNTQLVSELEAAKKALKDSILKREELTIHYKTLLQDNQMAFEALEHQLGRAKARVYNLDTDLRAAQYDLRKAEDTLENAHHQQEFQLSMEASL